MWVSWFRPFNWPHGSSFTTSREDQGDHGGCAQTDGPGLSQVCAGLADNDGARYNPLSEVRLRTPNEIRDVRNIVQMIIDPDGKGLPDHWSREGSAFLTGMILDQLCSGQDKTLSGLEARLCDPGQPIDDTMQQIMGRARSVRLARLDRFARHSDHHTSDHRACDAQHARQEPERTLGRDLGGKGISRALSRSGYCREYCGLRLSNHGSDESSTARSLYIVVPLARKNSLKPVIRLMLGQILHRLTEHLEFETAGR